MSAAGPIFIGGTNGSGTRIYSRFFEAAGVFQGEPKNYAFEPEAIIPFTRPEVPKLMAATGSPTYDLESIPNRLRESSLSWLSSFADEIYESRPSGYPRWGWKHPRNLFLTALLNHLFPDSFFVHVVRDGRDMALAPNKGDFRALRKLFRPQCDDNEIGAARFWSHVNLEVWRWGRATLGSRYILTKFEDLCLDPRSEGARILSAAELQPTEASEQILSTVSLPVTTGRWLNMSDKEREKIKNTALPALSQFRYV